VAVPVETLSEALSHWAREQPGRPALSEGDEELGYADLDRLVTEAAERLAGAGIRPSDRVALLGGNTLEWVVAFLGGLRLGAIVVPLNARLSRLELRRQLEVAEPRVVLASGELAGRVARPSLILERGHRQSLWRRPRAEVETAPGAADPALIAFTSGTTGTPKGATITHAALVSSAGSFSPVLGTSSADRTLVLVPLFHNTGFNDQLAHMLLVGGSVDLLREFSVAGALAALERRPATYLIAVPSIYRLLMLHERAGSVFAGCGVAVYGGASMPTAWIKELAERWPQLRLFNCYGLTEFTSVSHLLAPEHALTRPDSVGRPVEGARQQVVDGELWLAGPTRMSGYWRDDTATADVLSGDWLRTGDLGRIEDGFLFLAGRSAETINRGGEKIHPVQVEAALSELPGIAEAAVVGAPHPIFQERVVAWVVPRGGFDEDEARRHLAERVPDYAVPEEFVLADELPRNAAGKLDRGALREEARRVFAVGAA